MCNLTLPIHKLLHRIWCYKTRPIRVEQIEPVYVDMDQGGRSLCSASVIPENKDGVTGKSQGEKLQISFRIVQVFVFLLLLENMATWAMHRKLFNPRVTTPGNSRT